MEGLSDTLFREYDGKISERTLKAIEEIGMEKLTKIQDIALPLLLEYRDTAVCAKTGSGKTLLFLIAAIELLYELKWRSYSWTAVIILEPTRELAMQTYDVLKQLLKYHSFTHGLVMGGQVRKEEAEMLLNSTHIIVATPGRLLDHLQNTKGVIIKNVQCLIIDEADRMLDFGFEDEVKGIINILNSQTILKQGRLGLLFSATLCQKTKDFMQVALHKTARYVGMEEAEKATVEGLAQEFLTCPPERRFDLLHVLLKINRKKKVMVFFNSRDSVTFHHKIFNYCNLQCGCIHGKMKQNERNRALRKFRREPKGILLCTNVAARGLDIPMVDLVIQFDPPDDVADYIHRVGRTARGINGTGKAFLFLREEEKAFIKYLRSKRVPIGQATVKWNKIPELKAELEYLVLGNHYFKHIARKAFIAYIRSYRSHKIKNLFDESTLDHNAIAHSYGFPRPPYNFSKNQ